MLYDVWDDWSYLNESPAKIQAVTAEDVQRVANTYFEKTGKNVLWYFRKEGTAEDPALAGLSGQAKAFAKQALAQIESIEDPAQLEQGIAQMQAMKGQVPPELQPALDVVVAKATERLEMLKAAAGKEQ
jgi:hypothetical protein